MKRKVHLLIKSFCIGICSFFLFGCLSVKSDITLSKDGSGNLSLSYAVSKMMANIGRTEDDGRFIPLPVNREDFEKVVRSSEGLSLTSYKQSEDAENILIEAVISFEKADSLSALYGRAQGEGVAFKEEGGRRMFSQFIYGGLSGEPDPESLSLIETIFQGYNLSFSVTAPSRILSANMGTIQNNTVSYTVSIPALLQKREPVSLEISF